MSFEQPMKSANAITAELDPDVFRQAAELVASGEEDYSCHAIRRVVKNLDGYYHHRNNPYQNFFMDVFMPSREDWGNPLSWWSSTDWDGDRETRILSLLICADIIEAGGL